MDRQTAHPDKEQGNGDVVCRGRTRPVGLLIYLAHFLSAWGDRMWSFSVGIYLVFLDKKSLRLTAIYGFSMGGALLLFGSVLGSWVDRSQRLKVVRTYLFIQNISVALCAVTILLRIQYQPDMLQMFWGHMLGMTEATVIFLAVVAHLASAGCRIAVEKDWIVVIAGRKSDQLADLNSTTRAIDLACNILAPLAVGQVMTFASLKVAAATIAGWNIISMFIEYCILLKVYKAVPELAKKEANGKEKQTNESTKTDLEAPEPLSERTNHESDSVDQEYGKQSVSSTVPRPKEGTSVNMMENRSVCKALLVGMAVIRSKGAEMFRGWPVYMKQEVVFAGIALAGLYMTVLGFDSVPIGYVYALNIKEWVLGICMGLGSLMGILGTFVYKLARQRLGLEKTGMLGFAAIVACLSMCVMSIWTPGSPSDMYPYKIPVRKMNNLNCTHNSVGAVNFSQVPRPTFVATSTPSDMYKASVNSTVTSCEENRPWLSVVLLLAGIITSRVGLWVADLTVTQTFQERVEEKDRGKVNGVQSSLNNLLDMLKFALVIAAPEPHTFGFLIMLSFTFIAASACIFLYHSCKVKRNSHKFGTCMTVSVGDVQKQENQLSIPQLLHYRCKFG